jgi:hypothetical protein
VICLCHLVFKNKMWIIGGRKLPGSECSNKVKYGHPLTEANGTWSPQMHDEVNGGRAYSFL